MSLPRARSNIDELEKLVKDGTKKYVRYEEGAKLYSMGRNSFMELAKDAKAVFRYKGAALVNIQKVDMYIEEY